MGNQSLTRTETLKARYGEHYFELLGQKGGGTKTSATKKRGFGAHPELAKVAGRAGGQAAHRNNLISQANNLEGEDHGK